MNSALQRPDSISTLTRGYLICFTATILWSTTAILISYLTKSYQIPALVLAFWRDLFVAVMLAMVFLIAKPVLLKVPKGDRWFILGYGIELAVFNSLWTISVVLNGAAVSTVMAYSSAAFTAVLGWRFFGETLGRMKISAVALSLLGCILVAGAYDPINWRLNPVGVITGLASGLGFAAYSLLGREASRRSINPWTALFYTFGIASIFILAFNLFHDFLPAGVASANLILLGKAYSGWLMLLILAIGPTLGGYGLYTLSLRYLPASVANILATLEPPLTALLAYVLLGERFSFHQLFGGLLILAGVVVLRMSHERVTPQFAH